MVTGRRAALVEQLGRAFAAYRLYPGEIEKDAFQSAVGRVQEAAGSATATGPARLELRAGHFVDARDNGHAPLAGRLFDAGVELLIVSAAPSDRDLATLFDALLGQIAGEQLQRTLESAGVSTLRAGSMAPVEDAAAREPDDGDAPADRALRLLYDPFAHAEQLRRELTGDADADAQFVTSHVTTLVGHLEEGWQRDPELIRAIRRAVELLPEDVRNSTFGQFAADSSQHPTLAAVLHTLSDHQLAAAVGVAGAEQFGEDSRLDMLRALAAGDPSAEPMPGDLQDTAAAAFVESFDQRVLPSYFAYETDGRRLSRVLSNLREELRRALDEKDTSHLETLVDLLLEGEFQVDESLRSTFAAGLRGLLDAESVRSVLPDDPTLFDDKALPRLVPFGHLAIDPLFVILADEQEAGRRLGLVRMLTQLGRTDPDAVAEWLRDERWFVARNAVTILGRIGTEAVVPHLEDALGHRHPKVRVEAAKSIVLVGDAAGCGRLAETARDSDAEVREAAIRALASLLADEAVEALGQIACGGDVANTDRMHAVDLLAEHPSRVAGQVLDRVCEQAALRVRWHARQVRGERRP